MKKRTPSKLVLHRETLRTLADGGLQAAGGYVRPQQGTGGDNLSIPVCTQAVSDCYPCTKRLDGCPDTGTAV